MDFPTLAYRPDLESGMEISGSNFYGKSIINGMLRSFRLPLLINENYGILCGRALRAAGRQAYRFII